MLLRSRCCILIRLLPAVPRASWEAVWAMRCGCALLGHMEPDMGTHVISANGVPNSPLSSCRATPSQICRGPGGALLDRFVTARAAALVRHDEAAFWGFWCLRESHVPLEARSDPGESLSPCYQGATALQLNVGQQAAQRRVAKMAVKGTLSFSP